MPEPPLLDGLRVIELAAYVAAPLCGATLASLGAEVVRVDPPSGPVDRDRWPLYAGRSLYWMGLNRGKRSVTIDLRSERGRALVLDLVAEAGTCVTNLSLGDWLSYEALRERRTDVVLLRIVGDPDGRASVDYTVNAAVGLPWITGPEDTAGPVNHVLPAWDVIAAQMGVSAIIAAELRRVRTGAGSRIDLSLMNVAISTVSSLGLLAEAALVPEARARYGNYLYGSFGRDFRTADGRTLMVIALTPRQWRGLVAAAGIAEEIAVLERVHSVDLGEEGARFAHRAAIARLLEAWIGTRSLAEVGGSFDRHGVLWGAYQTLQQLVREDPRAGVANPLMTSVTQPGVGALTVPKTPIDVSGVDRDNGLVTPALGADTRAVLSGWLGLEGPELASLEREGIIGRSL